MKNFLLIVFVVGMCDACQGKFTKQSGFSSYGINYERDATLKTRSSDLNALGPLPEYELSEPQVKMSGMVNEHIDIPYEDFKFRYYLQNQ